MTDASTHKWTFRTRFRRRSFGWQSQPAIKRIQEAVSEIAKVAQKDARLGAQGAVLFLEKVSPAIEQVDSSSGAIGSAVNNAIATLSEIIAAAPVDAPVRDKWLERLWDAYLADKIPYIEALGDYWGELCGSPAVASRWADKLIGPCKTAWNADPEERHFFQGSTNCLSALLAAGRHEELLELFEMSPYKMWHYRQFGVKALIEMGRADEAIRYALEGRSQSEHPGVAARACEKILLDSGQVEEAYERFGVAANEAGTYLAWFRAVAKKYPHKPKTDVLADLVAHIPGEEGKWFAAAKSAKLFDAAIELANQSPCSPKTLIRAARDFETKNPTFALEAGLAALRWLAEGYGYKVTAADVRDAYSHTMRAAQNTGTVHKTQEKVRELMSADAPNKVTRALSAVL